MHAFIAGAWVLLVGGWALWVRAWLWRIELSRQLAAVLPDNFKWLPEGFGPEVRARGKLGDREWVLCWRVGALGVRTYLLPAEQGPGKRPGRFYEKQNQIMVPFEDQLQPTVLAHAAQAHASQSIFLRK